MTKFLLIIGLLVALFWYLQQPSTVTTVAQPTAVCTSPGEAAWSKLTVAQRLSIGLKCAGQP